MSERQTKLGEKEKINYSYGPYNKANDNEQWIRITEGCPNNCPYCYEPTEFKVFEIPEIIRNKVSIMDMNLICKPESLDIIKKLGEKRVNKKVVYYELICGIDYRFLTQELANALKNSRFKKPRIAWDWGLGEQYKIKDSVQYLIKAGYKPKEIMIFMICNWKIPYAWNIKKLDLCKVWGVKVCDCYYDNQTSPNIIPMYWKDKEIKDFRRKSRRHNQLINFGIDPDLSKKEAGR